MADKEWTLMFYFASDNPLTPSVVTQLKAIKQAGYHPDVNVVTHFDPQAEDTPTHVFDVNLINKLRNPGKSDIGFTDHDPYVRTLMEDKLWRDQKNRDNSDTIRHLLQLSLAGKNISYTPPMPPPDRVVNGTGAQEAIGAERTGSSRETRPKELGPKQSLSTFLEFCSENYKAKHYILFILGHGMVVGNDIFLFDEHVDSEQRSLSLIDLGDVLGGFARGIRNQGAEFELVSFHSCSVSSLEVAHELQYDQSGIFRGMANYMLASQGPAFVGSWPYREIVIRVLNDVDNLKKLDKETRAIEIKKMLVKIHKYIMHNSSDFLLAGYSFQVALCDLNKVSGVTAPLKTLSDELVKGLADPVVRNLILLAHWKSISFWHESYTDLFDFCFCLNNLCEEYQNSSDGMSGLVDTIKTACGEVLALLAAGKDEDDDKLIVRTDFAGPTYQYAHGLSVFFPWAAPPRNFMSNYNQYRFRATSWHKFLGDLEGYFAKTQRQTRKDEENPSGESRPAQTAELSAAELDEDIASICFNNEGPLNTSNALSDRLYVKTHPRDPMGDESTESSVKNYPHDTRTRRQRAREAAEPTLPFGPNAFKLFR